MFYIISIRKSCYFENSILPFLLPSHNSIIFLHLKSPFLLPTSFIPHYIPISHPLTYFFIPRAVHVSHPVRFISCLCVDVVSRTRIFVYLQAYRQIRCENLSITHKSKYRILIISTCRNMSHVLSLDMTEPART